VLHPGSQTRALRCCNHHQLPTDRSSLASPTTWHPHSDPSPSASNSSTNWPHCPGTTGLDSARPESDCRPDEPPCRAAAAATRPAAVRVNHLPPEPIARSCRRASGPGDSRARDPGRGGARRFLVWIKLTGAFFGSGGELKRCVGRRKTGERIGQESRVETGIWGWGAFLLCDSRFLPGYPPRAVYTCTEYPSALPDWLHRFGRLFV